MDRTPAQLRIQLLGGFGLQVGARTIPPQEIRGKASTLIKLLALAPAHRLHREQASDHLWPELDADAALNNLHGVLHKLRLVLEPDLARGTPSAYLTLCQAQLALHAPGGVWVDHLAFDLARTAARGSTEPTMYRAALELYRGDLLPDDPYADWALGRREALRVSYVQLVLQLATVHERRGELWAAISALKQVVTADPWHEEAQVCLMRCYARVGRRVDALRQYQRLATSLRELGVEPDAEARDMVADILAGRLSHQHSSITLVAPSGCGRQLLTGREQDVIDLVAHGLTNRQIASRLGLSRRTAETHVSRILRKVGAPSREQAAAWMRIRTPRLVAD